MVASITDVDKYYGHLTPEELLEEKWAAMPDFPWYVISDLGRAKSIKPAQVNGHLVGPPKNLILRPQYNPKTGYLAFRFYNEYRWEAIYAHRAVILAHEGPIKASLVCDHLNGDKTDNRQVNLMVTSVAHNLWRSDRHESYAESMIEMALNLRDNEDWPYQKIGDLIGVSHNTVRRWHRGQQKYLKVTT